ncbi:coagulation factor IX, putative [Ixodes scapularis]|uniref:Coagulation factor IX, putative n=1 Tax=Ixodes scapularis TaxID=6945 RepID=B7QAJ8_IXOSC|nr:coagulation factor IX, putative [Ixodes scapularis]|eukprot:XP_002412574.1 coagulation factor IX, putative [Ixodes scapularis]
MTHPHWGACPPTPTAPSKRAIPASAPNGKILFPRKASTWRGQWSRAQVVGGEDAAPLEFPWQAFFQRSDANFCGGSVINKEYIITAARCTKPTQIVGGEDAAPLEFPWQVFVVRKADYLHICGGSVINKEYIITAGHCTNTQLIASVDNEEAMICAGYKDVGKSTCSRQRGLEIAFGRAEVFARDPQKVNR